MNHTHVREGPNSCLANCPSSTSRNSVAQVTTSKRTSCSNRTLLKISAEIKRTLHPSDQSRAADHRDTYVDFVHMTRIWMHT
ncbi:hypothetical protein CY34DRAFT_802489 [Suillus luteus UH-Slu-Lm8-n1]|uniref:Uncharacterized protein n=1 Tax=Suillus luteus UH-Slu-Lm8-n1 TaxID=930992 RepID=A0A0D0BER4_9AGAM|nr:hypothetical protein CY34DRAFT_802489 [Suillus luteus UH-Slu-Lm8-n1]